MSNLLKIRIDFFTLRVILSFRHTKNHNDRYKKGKDYDHAKRRTQ